MNRLASGRYRPRTAAPATLLALLVACTGNDPHPAHDGHDTDTSSAPDQEEAACSEDEQVLFHCRVGARARLALCIQDPPTPGSPVRYRIEGFDLDGTSGTRTGLLDHDRVRLSSVGYAGGGEARIRFAMGGTVYTGFDRTVRTGFGPEGHHDPEFTAGVIAVDAEGGSVTHLCDNLASVYAAAYAALTREPFDDDAGP